MSTQTRDYRSVKAISNSLMGVYEDNFKEFAEYWINDTPLRDKKDDSLTMGSAIDTLLTRPEEFNDKFIIFQGSAPTGQMLQFCNALANRSDGTNVEGFYQAAYDEVGFKRDNLAKVIEKFTAVRGYFDFLIGSKEKAVLTIDQATKAALIVEQLSSGKYTRKYVTARTIYGKIEVFDQLEIYKIYREGIPVKGAIDRVIVDHNSKTIQPLDFKSSYNVDGFVYSYQKYRYYRQGSLYSHLLSLWATENGWGDYKILPFIFVVCSTTGGNHYTYQMSTNDLACARVGGKLANGQEIKGWEGILMEIMYLQDKGDWEFPYNVQVNDGLIPLNIFQ